MARWQSPLFIFLCARNLFGIGPAFVSLTLFAFCPTTLANGPLITSDMAATLFFFASVLCIWRVLHKLTWRTLLVSALVMSGLFLSKFGAFLILPFGVLLIAIQLLSDHATFVSFRGRSWLVQSRGRRAQLHFATVVGHALVVWVAIWAFYNFRFDMFAHKTTQPDPQGTMVVVDEPANSWTNLLDAHGFVQQSIGAAKRIHLLPEAFLYGFAYTWENAQYRRAFLNGQYSTTGWPQFFPYSALVKTPLPLFVLVALSLAWTVRTWRLSGDSWRARKSAITQSVYRTAPLWVLFLGYWAVAISSHLNIGHRHLMPTYPALLVAAGGAWCWTGRRFESKNDESTQESSGTTTASSLASTFKARRWPVLAVVVAACTVLFAAESLWRWPNYLAYFNQVAGGPYNAYRHLVDSSLDWGQDLPALKKWLFDVGLEKSPSTKTYLSYFGTGLPSYYGIDVELLPSYYQREPPKVAAPLQPGVYCISATMLQNVYTDYWGPWTQGYEDSYRKLSIDVEKFRSSSPEERDRLATETGPSFWYETFANYEQARFARLAAYLRQREPNFEINNSILIYVLNDTDVKNATDGPLGEVNQVP